MASRKPKPARELAARALCRMAGNPEEAAYKGKPLWMDYLPEADAVLEAIGWEPEARDKFTSTKGEVIQPLFNHLAGRYIPVIKFPEVRGRRTMRKLQCFAYGNGNGYEAICVDLDLAVQGETFDEVYESLNLAIATYIEDALKEDEATARRLLSRRSPWHVRTGHRLRLAVHLFARRLLGGKSEASFEVACPA